MAATTVYNGAAGTDSRLPSGRSIVELSSGVLIVCRVNRVDDDLEFFYSNDAGASWADTTSDITDLNTNDTYQPMVSMRVDASDAIWVTYLESAGSKMKVRRGTYSSGTITWDSGYDYTGTLSLPDVAADLCAFAVGGDDYAPLVYADLGVAKYLVVKRTSAGTYSTSKTAVTLVSTSSVAGISIDFHHTGDGVTVSGSAPHVYISVVDDTNNDLLYWRSAYSAGPTWSNGTQRTITATDATGTAAQDLDLAYDGTRIVMACSYNSTPFVRMWERDEADTATTARTGMQAWGNFSRGHPSLVIDPYTQDVYLCGGDTNFDPAYEKWTRSGASWAGSQTVVEAATVNSVRTLPWATTTGHFVWYDSSTFDIMYEAGFSMNADPSAPTWVNADNVAADVAETLTLDWTFNDPGDTQSAYTVRRKLGSGGTWNYWNGATWQASEDGSTKIASATTALVLASSWGSDGDATHYYGAKTWDSSDALSPWSADLRVVPSGQDNPTITAPTPTGTPTVGSTATVTWTVSTQTKYRVVVSDTSSTTNMDAGSLEFDTGVVVSTDTSITASFPTNSVTRYVRVQTWNDEGLKSDIDEVDVSVSYTPPATPTLVITADATDKNLDVVITNPGTGATELYNDVYRRLAGTSGSGIRVAIQVAVDGTHIDWLVGSGVAYEYLARVFSDTGGYVDSAWTA